MADRFHAHNMSSWSPWYYIGNNTDERFKACKDTRVCGYSETDTRRHQHDDGIKSVVKGVTVRKCGGCGATL